jgi:coenzyme F420-0:L-glutamate ligase / coenzyme F420-1:gamma-L-glutamate ligase
MSKFSNAKRASQRKVAEVRLTSGARQARQNELPFEPSEIRLIPIPLTDEIRPGDKIAEKLLESLPETSLGSLLETSLETLRFQSGDILVVKHKIVSKAEGRIVDLKKIRPSVESRAWGKQYRLDPRVIELALRESRAVIRRKNGVLITETHHGFVCANSGVDVSNVDGGAHALLLPEDPDRSAARIRNQIKKLTGLSIAVIITDSFGRPWREGLVDFCIGIAGMKALRDDRGRKDSHGYKLHASIEAVADELAAAAGLICGKLNRTPACIIRGFPYKPGRARTRDLLRPAASDLFR